MHTPHGRGALESRTTGSGSDIAIVTQVVLAERQGRDRGWWDQMRDQFWPDSTVRLSWYKGDGGGFVSGSQAMAQRGEVAVHRMFAPVVQVQSDRAHVEASASMRISVEVDQIPGDLVAYTRLNYRLERRDGVWRILSLDAIYEHTTLTPSVPGQIINIPADALASFRPSYALLAWNVARVGHTMSGGELGDDRPEDVAAFYEEVRQWLTAAE